MSGISANMDAAGYEHVIYAADGVITQQIQTSRGQGANTAAYQWAGSEQQASFCLAIRPESGLVNYGLIYDAYYQWYYASVFLVAGAAVVAVALIILLCTLVRRRTLAEAHRRIAAALGHIWMEPKLVLLLGGADAWRLDGGGDIRVSRNWHTPRIGRHSCMFLVFLADAHRFVHQRDTGVFFQQQLYVGRAFFARAGE